MDIGFVFVLLLSGCYVYGIPQEGADQKALVNQNKAVVVQTFSAWKGQCGCFEFSGDTLIYKAENTCDSILLCRVVYNIAITRGLHLKMPENILPYLPFLSDFHNMKPTEDIDFKNMNVSCLSQLLQKDIPSLLIKLQNMLCLFQYGKEKNNEALCKEFLKQLNIVLKDVGCTLDDILGTKDILDNLELTGTLLNFVCKLLGKTLSSLSDILGNVGLGLNKIGGGLLG